MWEESSHFHVAHVSAPQNTMLVPCIFNELPSRNNWKSCDPHMVSHIFTNVTSLVNVIFAECLNVVCIH